MKGGRNISKKHRYIIYDFRESNITIIQLQLCLYKKFFEHSYSILNTEQFEKGRQHS